MNMSNSKKIQLFYKLSIIGMVIGFITVGLCLVGFSATEYGNFNLYSAFCTQLGILSFGFQDGMLINYRKKQYDDMLPTLLRDLKFGFLFQTIILIISIIIIPACMIFSKSVASDTLIMMILAIISFYPITLLGNIRNAFSALGQFDIIGYVDFALKIDLLIGILLVVFCNFDVIFYIFVDIFAKLIVVIYLYYRIYKDYKKLCPQLQKPQASFKISDNFKKGMWILLGNWAFILIFSLDRNMLSNHAELVGIYSYAMFVISTIIQLILPLKSVIISQINEHTSKDNVYLMSKKLVYLITIIAILYIVFGQNIAIFLVNHLSNYLPGVLQNGTDIIEGLELSGFLLVILPVYICVNVLFSSLLTVKNQKLYALVETLNVIVTYIIYVSCVALMPQNVLYAVSIGTILNYFYTFLFQGLFLMGYKNIFKMFIITGIIAISCLGCIIFKQIYLLLILLVVICILAYKYFRR